MKILFVNPRFPRSLWGFQGIADLVGVCSGQAPFGLVTVAAMTPREFKVELQDENCGPVTLDTDADVVAIGCWSSQYHRARELAAEFRKRGKLVVVGGPCPTPCRYLTGLGVEVVPVATAALERLRDRVDLLALPILSSVRRGREELYQVVQQLQERVQADLDKLPKVIHVSVDGDRRALLDAVARLGLTFTRRIRRVRHAYIKAVETVMLPADAASRSLARS